MLPKGGTIQYKRIDEIDDGDITRQISHLVTLARGLLPADDAPIALPTRVKSLIAPSDDEDEEEDGVTQRTKLSLRQIRLSNIEAGTHNHVWNENGGIPSYKFAAGDFGYVPTGKEFKDFVILGNVIKDMLAELSTENHAYGTQWCWKDVPPHRAPIEPYILPGEVNW